MRVFRTLTIIFAMVVLTLTINFAAQAQRRTEDHFAND